MTDKPILERQATFSLVRAEGDDGLTLRGYAAVFNAETEINSWEGRFVETIAPGAFNKTIRDKGPKGIRLQFDHGHHPLIGSIPLGTFSDIKEDKRGLYVEARLTDNWLIQPIRDAIAEGAITGMSFRFRVVREEWDESGDTPVRTLRELELFEAGPVVWPAYEQTSVGVRAREIASALMDPEQRAEIARALIGTSDDAAPEGTSDEAAVPDEPAPATRRTARDARQKYRRLFTPDTKENAA